MSETVISEKQHRPRLKFIDMARSLAILLMLEGHFTGAALSNVYRKDEFILYKIWHNIHGLTSPLFFTVTGVIFVYLLSANNEIPFRDNIRVKKGYRRVLELLFWGYFIQLNIWSILQSFYYGSKFHLDWFYAFHVLQSIAVGIFFLLGIYGIFKWIGKGALHWYYLVAALLVFVGYAQMKNYIQLDEQAITTGLSKDPAYWPNGSPKFLQNMFYGQFSDFSFMRYSGYTILGGMLGSLIRTYEQKTREWWFGSAFIIVGILISLFIQPIFHELDQLTNAIGLTEKGVYELNATAFIRFGQVVSVLGVFMLLDKYVRVSDSLYLKMGQNTLPIYVVHVIILYGGIFGFGLKPLAFDQDLDPWTSVSISLSAIVFFVIMVRYIETLEHYYTRILDRITFGIRK